MAPSLPPFNPLGQIRWCAGVAFDFHQRFVHYRTTAREEIPSLHLPRLAADWKTPLCFCCSSLSLLFRSRNRCQPTARARSQRWLDSLNLVQPRKSKTEEGEWGILHDVTQPSLKKLDDAHSRGLEQPRCRGEREKNSKVVAGKSIVRGARGWSSSNSNNDNNSSSNNSRRVSVTFFLCSVKIGLHSARAGFQSCRVPTSPTVPSASATPLPLSFSLSSLTPSLSEHTHTPSSGQDWESGALWSGSHPPFFFLSDLESFFLLLSVFRSLFSLTPEFPKRDDVDDDEDVDVRKASKVRLVGRDSSWHRKKRHKILLNWSVDKVVNQRIGAKLGPGQSRQHQAVGSLPSRLGLTAYAGSIHLSFSVISKLLRCRKMQNVSGWTVCRLLGRQLLLAD